VTVPGLGTIRAAARDRSDDLDSRQGTRDAAILAVTSQAASQRGPLGFARDQLHERGRVEIELHCSSARIDAGTEDA